MENFFFLVDFHRSGVVIFLPCGTEQGSRLCLLVSPKRLALDQSYDDGRGACARACAWHEFGPDPGRCNFDMQFDARAACLARRLGARGASTLGWRPCEGQAFDFAKVSLPET